MLRHQSFLGNYAYAARATAPRCCLSAGRPHAPRQHNGAHGVARAGHITAAMSGKAVRVRSLQRPWVVFSVGGARQTARALTARCYGTLPRRTPAYYHGALPWPAARYHGRRRMAASRVSFFCVSRAAVLTCFDGDVNSLVSLQGRRKV